MTAADMGIQLARDFILVRQADSLVTWKGLDIFEDWVSDQGFATEEEAITNACEELAAVVLPDVDESEPPVRGEDFIVFGADGVYRWLSLGPVFGNEYASEKSFITADDAVNHAVAFLAEVYEDSFFESSDRLLAA